MKTTHIEMSLEEWKELDEDGRILKTIPAIRTMQNKRADEFANLSS